MFIFVTANGIAGLIICPLANADDVDALRQLQAARFPLVFVDRYIPGLVMDYVGADKKTLDKRKGRMLLFSLRDDKRQ